MNENEERFFLWVAGLAYVACMVAYGEPENTDAGIGAGIFFVLMTAVTAWFYNKAMTWVRRPTQLGASPHWSTVKLTFDTYKFYKLVSAEFAGHPFPCPDHVWTGGEIKQSWAFCHPYDVTEIADHLVITGSDGDRQEWVAA